MIVNNEIKDIFIVLLVRLLDGIESLIQLGEESSPAVCIRLFAISEAHIKSLITRAAEESSQNVEYGNPNLIVGCKANGKLNPG